MDKAIEKILWILSKMDSCQRQRVYDFCVHIYINNKFKKEADSAGTEADFN